MDTENDQIKITVNVDALISISAQDNDVCGRCLFDTDGCCDDSRFCSLFCQPLGQINDQTYRCPQCVRTVHLGDPND